MKIPKGGIAFFDSGIGGLTVLSECRKRLPDALFYYYGDNSHAPYGNLSEKRIKRYVFRVFRYFHKLRVRAVVIACNTATAVCVEELRKKYSFPIIGTEPALRLAARGTMGEIFVLTTQATAKSSRLQKMITDCRLRYSGASVRVCPCARLAAEVETHILDPTYTYRPFLPTGAPAAVVLGCTHYIYIKEYIRNFYGCAVFDGNEGVAERLCAVTESWMTKTVDKSVSSDQNSAFDANGRPLYTTSYLNRRLKRLKSILFSRKREREKRFEGKNADICDKAGCKRDCSILFLGKNRSYNRKIYKQMFTI